MNIDENVLQFLLKEAKIDNVDEVLDAIQEMKNKKYLETSCIIFLNPADKLSPLCHRLAQRGYIFATEFKTERLCGSQLLSRFASQLKYSVF